MAAPDPLSPDRLYSQCDPEQFDFRTTDDLTGIENSMGQDRAAEAVRFGIGIRCDGYNMYALGPPGTGKHTMVRRHLEEAAAEEPLPRDWVYVNNFAAPNKPRAIGLPPGKGIPLRSDMDRLIADLRQAIPTTFESDDYRSRREALEEQFKESHEKALNEIQERARKRNIAMVRTPMGLAMAPTRDGEVLNPEQFHKLPEAEQEKTKEDITELEEQLQEVMRQAAQWEREHREKLRELNRGVTEFVVGHMIDELRTRYADIEGIITYLDEVRNDIIENSDEFLGQEESGPEAALKMAMQRGASGAPSFRRYQVNVIIDHGASKAAPVIYENHPTQPNLIGGIEHIAQFGALITDFNLIKPGALLRANGGYLILDALKVLTHPYAWDALKRALQSDEVRIEGVAESLGIAGTASLQPEPIPLAVKVVLLGDRRIYYLLSQLDPDFPELFKVAVDFDDVVDRTTENSLDYARMIAMLVKKDSLRPLDRNAVARIIEHAARLTGDSEKLSARMALIVDLLHETHYWARQSDAGIAGTEHVQKAIDAQIRRADRIRERIQEEIHRGTIMIETEGAVAGQVNGLSVLQLGGFAFGQPSRITARVRMGRGKVVDIEREVELGGPLHSKGVLILSGFLGARYARERPLALSASLVFEQSYGGVDGDSASSAELYALLSALSDLPISQSFAVTGSVDQRGKVQPIGGANEKIEGFFDVCRARGLTGDQGVLVPSTNVKHLMLRADVVAAAAEGKFRIFAVETIDQGIEILTGVPAGEADEDGNYPDGTVNGKVQKQLAEFAEKARAFAAGGRDNDK